MDLMPINGCVLVRLTEAYSYVHTPDKKYDTKTSGILMKVANDLKTNYHDKNAYIYRFPDEEPIHYVDLVGKKVYFESYKDDTVKEEDGEKYALIKATELKGYEDA